MKDKPNTTMCCTPSRTNRSFAHPYAEMDIAAGRAEYNDDGERLPTEPEISYYGMIAAFETLGGEWKRNADGRHWLCLGGIVASTQSK